MLSNTLKKYIGFTEFDSDCESGRTGKIYSSFQTKMRNDLKKQAEENGMELYKFNKNHYEFSAVLKDKFNDRFVYVSISDVRFDQDAWANKVLYRTMKNDHDWTGGSNNFTTWESVGLKAKELLEREAYFLSKEQLAQGGVTTTPKDNSHKNNGEPEEPEGEELEFEIEEFDVDGRNSLLNDSGVCVASLSGSSGEVEVVVSGDTKISWDGEDYTTPDSFPDDLIKYLQDPEKNKALAETHNYYESLTNWFNCFAYDSDDELVCDDTIDLKCDTSGKVDFNDLKNQMVDYYKEAFEDEITQEEAMGLDKLANDQNLFVRDHVDYYLKGNGYVNLKDWIKKNPDKCALPENQKETIISTKKNSQEIG